MAIFNEAFTNECIDEAVERYGKYVLSKEELHDPKFRKAQYDKVYAFVKDTCESEAFKEKFNISISLFNYYEDDDEADIFNKWISRKGPYVLDITYFPEKEERESEDAKSAANFIIKSFSEYKKKNPKSVFGNLKYNEKYGYIMYRV